MGAGKGYFDDYPKRVGFILSNEFCERFSFYGMKAILVIFLTRALNFSDDDGTAIYHGFNMACYFMPIFGALIADGFLGHYKTIFIISIVYAIGNVVMATGAVPFHGDYITALPFVGLVLIAIGTGGIKPCVAAFGANQFEPHQIRQKQTFFSMFYMAINCGSLISMIITPIIRSNVECFGGECYALAFGVPAALMLVAVALFLLGTHWYTITPPGENTIGKLFGCIWLGLKAKCCCSKNDKKRDHWLDYADSKYDKRFVADVKSVMRVLFMFIPLPVFYALFDQQGSRWTLQAGQLDGRLGGSFVLQPDLLQAINPILVVILVPLFESLLFPCLDKLKIPNRPLQRLGVGMTLAGTAFIVSAFLQMGIENSKPAPPLSGEAQFKLINTAPCTVSGHILNSTGAPIETFNMDMYKDNKVHVPNIYTKPEGNYSFQVNFTQCQGAVTSAQVFTGNYSMNSKGSYNMVAFWNKDKQTGELSQAQQPIEERTHKGQAKLQMFNTWHTDSYDVVTIEKTDTSINATYLRTSTAESVPAKGLEVKVGAIKADLDSVNGAVYTGVLHYQDTDPDKEKGKVISFYQDVSPNSLTILLMLPQYVVMTTGEVFFSVTGLSFAYSQSPVTMKAVLQAAWLLNNSLGNCLVMIITAIGSLPSQTDEFFMFAGLMYATVIIFAIMSLTYVYVDQTQLAEPDKKDDDESSGYDNYGADEADELPPKYDVVMTDGESPIHSTYM